MSIGNLKDQGNKGNNFPYQLRTLQLLGAINDGIAALPGVDYETRTTTYEAIGSGTGYSIGDIVVRYDIIDVATSTVVSTVWFNQTLQTTITPAPLAADLVPISAPSGVTVLNSSLTVDSGAILRTPNFLRPTASNGTVTAGTYSMSFASVGTGNAIVGGMILKTGETLNFDAGAIDNTLGAVAYDTTTNAGAELIIITLT
jgi:hypothetical protein